MLILNKFPTHVAKTKNKIEANKYWKINSQGIYNGAIGRFQRNIVVGNMHKYIIDELSSQEIPKITSSVQLQLDIFIPVNYSDVRRVPSTGIISWKPPKEDYLPINDEDNIRWIWEKCIKDSLTKLKVWPDDNLQYCRGTNSMVHFVKTLDERRIEIDFIKLLKPDNAYE